MSTKTEKGRSHVIFLSVNPATLDMPHKEFFEKLCSQVTSEDGQYLYYLDCTELYDSHPIYLEVKTVIQTSGKKLNLLIPHSMVLAIWKVGKDDRAQGIGFLRS